MLRNHRMMASVSRPGNPYDNASCESFMKTLKQEEIYANDYRDLEHLVENVEAFLEHYYNRCRLHSALGYRSPEEFEKESRQHNAGMSVARPRQWPFRDREGPTTELLRQCLNFSVSLRGSPQQFSSPWSEPSGLRQFLWSGFRSPTIASESTIRVLIGSVNTSAFLVTYLVRLPTSGHLVRKSSTDEMGVRQELADGASDRLAGIRPPRGAAAPFYGKVNYGKIKTFYAVLQPAGSRKREGVVQ